MRRDEALAKLRTLEATLRGQGLAHLYLLGSVARDDATDSSDVDVAFELEPGAKFDAFDQGRISLDIADVLGVPVDLIERRTLSSRMARQAGPDLIQIF